MKQSMEEKIGKDNVEVSTVTKEDGYVSLGTAEVEALIKESADTI